VVGAALSVIMFSEHDIGITVNADLEYSDFVSIILTALAVILAALAAFLGAMALYSWRNFDTRVKSQVEDYLNEFVKPTDRYEAVKDLIDDHWEKTKKLAEAEKELENLSNFDEDAV
jgi:hypothetical protein